MKLVEIAERFPTHSGRLITQLPQYSVIALVVRLNGYAVDLIVYNEGVRKHTALSAHDNYREALRTAWHYSRENNVPMIRIGY